MSKRIVNISVLQILFFLSASVTVFANPPATVNQSESTARLGINLIIPEILKVIPWETVGDQGTAVELSPEDPTVSGITLTFTRTLSLYSNSNPAYNTAFTGSGNKNSFTLTAGNDSITYSVRYNNGSGINKVTPGIIQRYQNTDRNGTSHKKGEIMITLDEHELESAKPNLTYSGTLTMRVLPE